MAEVWSAKVWIVHVINIGSTNIDAIAAAADVSMPMFESLNISIQTLVAADLWTGVADEYVQLYAPFFQLFWSRSPSCLNPEHSRSILVPRWTNYFFQRTLRCGIYGQGYKHGGCEEPKSFCRSPKVYSQFSSSCSQQFGKEEIEKIRGYLCDAKVRTVWPDMSICRHFGNF